MGIYHEIIQRTVVTQEKKGAIAIFPGIEPSGGMLGL
jgi:hypothetical protein